ncbi:MAG TPA: multidrug efflux MFS transporter [Firmicutes bacterium]|nr:multidrug efflux MFS transporter [Bacillota bacterium]
MFWRRNLYVLWTALFFGMLATTLILPFLPLYVEELGVTDQDAVAMWSALLFSGNFLTQALFSPLWGSLADRYGRKLMALRSFLAVAIFNYLMSYTATVGQLLVARVLMGSLSGFIAASVAIVATGTPDEHLGYALGFLQTGQVAGTVVGPLVGGFLGEFLSFRMVFRVAGGMVFLSFLLALFLVKETFVRSSRTSSGGLLADIKLVGTNPGLLQMFVVLLLAQFSIQIVEPILTVYVKSLQGSEEHLTLVVGIIFAATGLANVAASPFLGRRGDCVGHTRILFFTLLGAGIFYLPQALVRSPWQLLALRALLGVFMGGIIPCANALTGTLVAPELRGRAYGVTSSAVALGNLIGPLAGGALASLFGLRSIFLATGLLLVVDAFWVRRAVRAAALSPLGVPKKQRGQAAAAHSSPPSGR